MRITKIALLLSCLSAPSFAQEAADDQPEEQASQTQVTLIGGADYTTGDVNDQDYETTSVSAAIAVTSGRFSILASLPYVTTSAPADLIVSQGGVLGTPLLASPTTQTTQVRREGIGDLIVQAGYLLPVDGINAAISGTVKVPTAASEAGLGSGEFDYGVSGQLSKRVGSIVPFVSADYTVIGEPQGYDVRNTFSGAAGSHILLGESSSVSLSYAYAQSATDGFDDRQSVGAGLNTSLSSRLRLSVDGSAGLSADAPDARVGLRLGLGF